MDMSSAIKKTLWIIIGVYLHTTLTLICAKSNRRGLRIKDCGTEQTPIQVIDLEVKPLVVRIPGKVRIWTTLNITEDLPEYMGARVFLDKVREDGTTRSVLKGRYYKDVCNILNAHYDVSGCPKAMRMAGVPCRCPFTKGVIPLQNRSHPLKYFLPNVNIPIRGEYKMLLKILDGTDKRELGCVQLNFSVKKRKHAISPYVFT